MSDSDTQPNDVFDVDRIRRLVELMEGHDLREIDLRQNEQRIRLCRGAEITYAPLPTAPPPAPGPHVAASPVEAASPQSAPAAAPLPERSDEHVVLVRSPMVGTFYVRGNPNAEPFVKVGDMVEPETTVCIIEAMKVFNEIPAETRGKIVAILVDEEEPVDFGRPLFKIDTSGS